MPVNDILSSASLLVRVRSFSISVPLGLPIMIIGSLVLNPYMTWFGAFSVLALTELFNFDLSVGKNLTQLAVSLFLR